MMLWHLHLRLMNLSIEDAELPVLEADELDALEEAELPILEG